MADNSGIQWTDATWNPVAGCSPVSPGCTNCYAATMARRLEAMGQAKYTGTAERRGTVDVFTGVINTDEAALDLPLRWRKPKRIFVNSMSDLFHEGVPDEFVLRVFDVMRQCTWAGGQGCGRIGGSGHTFQVLTKRPERMQSFVSRLRWTGDALVLDGPLRNDACHPMRGAMGEQIWLGTSVEDQQRADERIPHLLKTPAAVRFLSCEPLLGPVDLQRVCKNYCPQCRGAGEVANSEEGGIYQGCPCERLAGLRWVIVGGESGPGARPMQVEWARSIVKQCQAAGVAVFVKQLGADPVEHDPRDDGKPWRLTSLDLIDRKGGDLAEWPDDLRVREFPEVQRCPT